MSNVMIDLMRGCLILVVIVIVGGSTLAAIVSVSSQYMEFLGKVLIVGGTFLASLIVSSVITGVCFLLLNINDNLDEINEKLSATQDTK